MGSVPQHDGWPALSHLFATDEKSSVRTSANENGGRPARAYGTSGRARINVINEFLVSIAHYIDGLKIKMNAFLDLDP